MARIKHYNTTTKQWEYSDISSAVKGETGATPNLTIGTVTTLNAGSNATATITGTAENPVLNLGIPKGATGATGASGSGGLSQADADSRYVNITGDGMTGTLYMNGGKIAMTSDNPYLSMVDTQTGTDGTTWYFQVYQNHLAFGPTYANAVKVDKNGNMTVPGNMSCSGGNVYTSGNVLYGAAYNDYAEYRETAEEIEAGRVVCENNDDTLSLSQERLQPGAEIVSDTFGFAIGQTEKCGTPIAVSGRALAYPFEDRNTFKAGDAVCAGPKGTVSKMTREEIKEYPDRILGTVSAVPEYETWGQDNVPVNGRIWIRIR